MIVKSKKLARPPLKYTPVRSVHDKHFTKKELVRNSVLEKILDIHYNKKEVITMNSTYKINAIYRAGMFKLLESINLADGTLVKLNVEPQVNQTQKTKPVFPNRFIPAGKLSPLVGIVSLGGDSLSDSESLYDSDWH